MIDILIRIYHSVLADGYRLPCKAQGGKSVILSNDYIALADKIDYSEINDKLKRGPEGEISTPNSKVKVYVICTNEELMIARDTKEIVEAL